MKPTFKFLRFTALALVLLLAVALATSWAPDVPVDSLKPRWAAVPSQFIAIDGMQVHLRDEGPRDDPSPIVLLHGTSSSLHTWDGWVQALKEQRRVIRFDLPAFGLTGPHPRGAYDISKDDRLKLQRVVLGGNSLGAQIAWHVALSAPQRVDKLILVDATGFPMEPSSVPLAWRMARIPVLAPAMELFLPRAVVESSLRNVYGQPDRVTPQLVDQLYDITRRQGNRAALTTRLQLGFDTDTARLPDIKAPTLILWGGQDRLVPPSHGERFERAIVGSQRVVFESLGHVPHEEDAALTVGVVKVFLGL